jgi:hypothetical protein
MNISDLPRNTLIDYYALSLLLLTMSIVVTIKVVKKQRWLKSLLITPWVFLGLAYLFFFGRFFLLKDLGLHKIPAYFIVGFAPITVIIISTYLILGFIYLCYLLIRRLRA